MIKGAPRLSDPAPCPSSTAVTLALLSDRNPSTNPKQNIKKMAAEVLPVVTLIPVIRTLTLVLSSQTLFLQHNSVPMPNSSPSYAQLVASHHASYMPTPNPSPI